MVRASRITRQPLTRSSTLSTWTPVSAADQGEPSAEPCRLVPATGVGRAR
jgi:hypothetical protein